MPTLWRSQGCTPRAITRALNSERGLICIAKLAMGMTRHDKERNLGRFWGCDFMCQNSISDSQVESKNFWMLLGTTYIFYLGSTTGLHRFFSFQLPNFKFSRHLAFLCLKGWLVIDCGLAENVGLIAISFVSSAQVTNK